ncbi:sigma factor [Thalassobacillus sp. CUG 92003]|uniref:sigma factor n=1 Tax=Thalassobacillus sp. CUG 92003 TaxID=2736641 RepID=UPI0015E636E2|nr:sigma factor [Thalassobacillus sp. CUG 92003]
MDAFEKVVKENSRLIHYFIHRLHIQDDAGDYYTEGLLAMWEAYETYDSAKGSFSSYMSFKIRTRLIDLLRKDIRRQEVEAGYRQQAIHEQTYVTEDYIEDQYLWNKVQSVLTDKQWKWVYYYVIED